MRGFLGQHRLHSVTNAQILSVQLTRAKKLMYGHISLHLFRYTLLKDATFNPDTFNDNALNRNNKIVKSTQASKLQYAMLMSCNNTSSQLAQPPYSLA